MLEVDVDVPCEEHKHSRPLKVTNIKVNKTLGGPSFANYIGPMSDTRRNDGKADVTIKFNGKPFKAHKEVLKKASEYFGKKATFQSGSGTGTGKAKRPKTSEFDLNAANVLPEGCKDSTLNQLINFAYTGILPLRFDGFQDLMVAAVALQFQEALRVYDSYFRVLFKREHRVMSTATAADILSLSETLHDPIKWSECKEHLEMLCDNTSKYILEEPLDELISNGQFLKAMSAEAMVAFLSRSDLAKPDEENKVLDLTLAWLKHDWARRKQYAKKVLQKVRLGLVPRDRLTGLDSMVMGIPECKKLLEEVLKLLDTKEAAVVPLESSHPHVFSPRNTMIVNALIALGPGGIFGGQTFAYFNEFGRKKKQGWQDFCNFEPIPDVEPIHDASVVSIDGKLYMAGGSFYQKSWSCDYKYSYKSWNQNGFYEGKVGGSAFSFDDAADVLTFSITNPWTELPSMKDSRRLFPMVHMDGYLYAIGGIHDGHKVMKESERYSFKDKKWEKIADLTVPCYCACATAYKGKLLVYGSQPVKDSDTPAQHNLQLYDPDTNKWYDLLTEHHKILKFKKEIVPPAAEAEDSKEQEKNKGKEDKDDQGEDEDDEDEEAEEDEEEESSESEDDEEKDGLLLPNNALVVDGEDCFRVVYTVAKRSSPYAAKKLQPLVNHLEFDFSGTTPSVMVGKPQNQELMPNTDEGSLQINNNVYVNMKGCVHNTGIKILPDQKAKVDLGVWKKLQDKEIRFENLSIASLTFDKKEALCDKCVKGKTCTNMEEYRDKPSSGSESD